MQFDEAEKLRMKEETLRLEKKQTRQTAELKAKNKSIIEELNQVYVSDVHRSLVFLVFIGQRLLTAVF